MNREEAKAKYVRRETASTTPAGSLCRNGLGTTPEKTSSAISRQGSSYSFAKEERVPTTA